MARSNAKTTACFTAATGLTDAEAKRIGDAADKYNTGDITADYVSAVQDVIAQAEQLRFAIDKQVNKPKMSTVASLTKSLTSFMGVDSLGRNVIVVGSADDLSDVRDLVAFNTKDAMAWTRDGKAYIIADRVPVGQERAVFMHEVGGHLGLDRLLPSGMHERLADQIREWAKRDDGSIESQVAKKALARAESAGTEAEDLNAEHIGYFLEEAMKSGMNPTANTEVKGWFRTLWAAFKVAIRKLGFNKELTAQDVLNLGMGAARLEVNGNWHGTAAVFRKFDHAFMGAGEGAQAFSWGTYTADKLKIARDKYMKDDIRRKTSYNNATLPKDPAEIPDLTEKERNYYKRAVVDYQNDTMYRLEKFIANHDNPDDTMTLLSMFAKVREAFPNSGPEGQLLRTDRNVRDSEMLHWYDELANQPPKVKGVINELLDSLDKKDEYSVASFLDEQLDRFNMDRKELTGKQLIGNEQRPGILIEAIENGLIPEANDKVSPFQALSELLHSKGIKGTKQLDSTSRSDEYVVNWNGKQYTYDQIKEMSKAARGTTSEHDMVSLRRAAQEGVEAIKQYYKDKLEETRQMLIRNDKESHERYGLPFDQEKAEKDADKSEYTKYHRDRLKFLEDNNITTTKPAATYNHILYSDKDIQRVASLTAADKDRVKFSKAAPELRQTQSQAKVQSTIDSFPPKLRPMANAVSKLLSYYGNKALNTINFSSDLLARAADMGLKSAEKYKELENQRASFVGSHERLVQAIVDGYPELPERLKGTKEGSVNYFLQESTRKGLWGFQPKYLSNWKVDIDPEMKKLYDALGKEGQDFVEKVFQHGAYTLNQKKEYLKTYTSSTYDALIKAARDAGDEADAKMLENDKAKALRGFGSLMRISDKSPYAPLKRFGKFVVMAKSDEYLKAEQAGDDAAMKKLEKDENHYYVDFAESYLEADALRTELLASGNYSTGAEGVRFKERELLRNELFRSSGTVQALEAMRKSIEATYENGRKSKEDIEIARKLQNLVTELYLQSLADSSARKSEIRRRGIAGDIDMVRSFEVQGKADANMLGAMRFNDGVSEAINDMRKEARTGDQKAYSEKSQMLNEILARHLQGLTYTPAAWSNFVTNTVSKVFLATSPAYYLQNATQPWMMSLPMIAGKHGYPESASAMSKAYSDVIAKFGQGKVLGHFNFDLILGASNTAMTNDEKVMVQRLLDAGLIDIGMANELGKFRIDGNNKLVNNWNMVDEKLRGLQTKLEALNRVTSALAAYRMEKAKGGDTEAAVKYAARILSETHGDYSAWNAPRMFNNDFGKVALQFKKYQLIQLSLMAKLLKNSFTNADPKEKAAARRAMAFMLTQAAVVGGAKAMPSAAILTSFLGKAFGEGFKEPPEYVVRRWIGNEAISDVLFGGLGGLIGADTSKFGGMGNMLSILPFTDIDLTSRQGFANTAFALIGGPAAGLGMRAADGLGAIQNGNVWKGLENFMPTGFSAFSKAVRTAVDGVQQKDGDTLVSSDEVTMWNTALQAVGITPETTAKRMMRQNADYDISTAVRDKGIDIKRDYNEARKSGDSAAAAEARQRWAEYQEARVRAGFTKQPLSELMKGPQSQTKREKETVNGIQSNPNKEKFVKELANI